MSEKPFYNFILKNSGHNRITFYKSYVIDLLIIYYKFVRKVKNLK